MLRIGEEEMSHLDVTVKIAAYGALRSSLVHPLKTEIRHVMVGIRGVQGMSETLFQRL